MLHILILTIKASIYRARSQ